MKELYQASNPPTQLTLQHTSQNDIPYWQGTCPACRQETLSIFDNAIEAYCHNGNCNAKFSMFSFCKDVLGFEHKDMVAFILGKTKNINEFDYRDFARVVHKRMFREEEGKSQISFSLPEDREPAEPCPICGGHFFMYRITQTTVTPYCLYCGQYLPVPRKTKNLNKKRRSKHDADWAWMVKERYDGKCALCGSTE